MNEQTPKRKAYLVVPPSTPMEAKAEETELNIVRTVNSKAKLVVCVEERTKDRDKEKRDLHDECKISIIDGKEVILMPLTGKYGRGKYVKLYREDYERVKHVKWHLNNSGYPRNRGCGCLHKFILEFEADDRQQVDHINHDKLDCRRDNLRLATRSENMYNSLRKSSNTSGITGVNFHTLTQKWHAYIGKDKTQINLGYFTSKEEAIDARRKGEMEYYGYNFNNAIEIKEKRLDNYKDEAVGYIGLGGRDGVGKYALVSLEDFDKCIRVKWYIHTNGYVHTVTHGLLHRFILNPDEKSLVDHKNGDRLDNRRENLRICSFSDNTVNSRKMNESNHRGVVIHKSKREKKYEAVIKYKGERKSASFLTLEEAISWRKAKEREIFGEENAKILEERRI